MRNWIMAFSLIFFLYNPRFHLIFQTDASTAFLRAARAGQLDKILALLNQDIDINVSNAVSYSLLYLEIYLNEKLYTKVKRIYTIINKKFSLLII